MIFLSPYAPAHASQVARPDGQRDAAQPRHVVQFRDAALPHVDRVHAGGEDFLDHQGQFGEAVDRAHHRGRGHLAGRPFAAQDPFQRPAVLIALRGPPRVRDLIPGQPGRVRLGRARGLRRHAAGRVRRGPGPAARVLARRGPFRRPPARRPPGQGVPGGGADRGAILAGRPAGCPAWPRCPCRRCRTAAAAHPGSAGPGRGSLPSRPARARRIPSAAGPVPPVPVPSVPVRPVPVRPVPGGRFPSGRSRLGGGPSRRWSRPGLARLLGGPGRGRARLRFPVPPGRAGPAPGAPGPAGPVPVAPAAARPDPRCPRSAGAWSRWCSAPPVPGLVPAGQVSAARVPRRSVATARLARPRWCPLRLALAADGSVPGLAPARPGPGPAHPARQLQLRGWLQRAAAAVQSPGSAVIAVLTGGPADTWSGAGTWSRRCRPAGGTTAESPTAGGPGLVLPRDRDPARARPDVPANAIEKPQPHKSHSQRSRARLPAYDETARTSSAVTRCYRLWISYRYRVTPLIY